MSPKLKQQAVGDRVRLLRTGRGISLRALALQTGFSASFMSQVENGQASPSLDSMERIAEALGVTLSEFFAAAAEGAGGRVLRARDRQAMASGWSSAEIEALAPMGSRYEPVQVTLHAGGRSGKHPLPRAEEEFAYVLEGEVTLTLGPESHLLGPGDSVTILAGEARLWEHRGRASVPARLLIVGSQHRAARPRRATAGRPRPRSRSSRA
jgi:transcriptional regulator with XRE-family HTH domain